MNEVALDQYLSRLRNIHSLTQEDDIKALRDDSFDSLNRIQMINKETIEILLSILRATPSETVKTSALSLLCNLSAENEAHDQLCEADTLNFIMSFLTTSNRSKMLRRVIGILSNLMTDNERKTRIGSLNVLVILVECLSNRDEKLKKNAACALWKLTENHYANQAKIVEHKLDERLPQITNDNCSFYLKAMKRSCAIFIREDEISDKEYLTETKLNIVFRGKWKGSEVAIKTYIGSSMPEMMAKETLDEAVILKELSHVNVIKFYKLISKQNVPAMLVMEYASQGSLRSYLSSYAAIAWSVRLRIAIELAKGLAYIHSKHVVHGDIKSLNVLLDQNRTPKWCDFGFSTLKKHAINTSQVLLMQQPVTSVPGTLRWMAPELLEGRQCVTGRKTDIWAFGMVLFEIASRELPFAGARDEARLIRHILEDEGEMAPRECERLYPFFGNMMKQCCKKDPRQRPTSEEIVTTLSQHYAP